MGLFDRELQKDTFEMDPFGTIVMRELKADELLECTSLCVSVDPEDGVVHFNSSLHTKLKIAVSLETPNLGATAAERIARVDELGSMAAMDYQVLVAHCESLTSLERSRILQLQEIIEGVPALAMLLRVLSEKNGWLEDLDGVSVAEIELWMAFYQTQESQASKALQALQIMGG